MLPQYIQVTRHLYEEPYTLSIVMLVSTGSATGGLEFCMGTHTLLAMGQDIGKLFDHPRSNYRFSWGSEYRADRRTNLLKLWISREPESDGFYIRIRMNNNHEICDLKPSPHSGHRRQQLTDLTLKMSLADVRQLGDMIVEFANLQTRRLFWSPKECMLDNEVIDIKPHSSDNYVAALAALPPVAWQRPTFPKYE